MQAWYDGVIVKAERASHIHPLPRGGTYGECQCAFTIGFSLETDTTKRRPPTFAMRVCGTRYLAFRSIIDGTVADVIAGRIGRQNFKQSWLPEFLEDVSRYSALPCVNPPRGSFRRNHGVDRNREPERVAMCSAPETPARDSESSAFAWGGEESESVRSGSQVQQPTDPGPSPRREETTETVTGRGSLEGARLQELDDVRAAEINKRLDERIDRYLGKGELTETGAPSQDNEADASSTERRTEADVTLPECRVKGSGVESVRTSDFTWLRRLDENETGREKVTSETRPVGLMGTGNVSLKRKKPAGKNDSTSKRMKREGENENPLLGSREAALPSEDWWATLAAAEERANAAAGRSDGRNETPDPNGVRPRPNDFPGASPPFARSTRQQGADVLVPPKRAKLRGGEKEATAKYVGQQEKAIRNDRVGVSGGGKADKVLGGRGAKQTFAKLVKAKKASVWSDSEDEQSGPSAARGAGIWPSDGDGQDPVATAWEQCALLGRERAMRDALAAGALAREEIARAAEESAGRDCERRAHALRQDGDGVYCTECGCLVRQLTEADVRQPTPATDSKRYLAPHDVAEDDPEPPRKKKKVGTGPVKNKKREPAGDNEAERLESGTVPAEPSGEKFLREQMLPHQVEAFEFLKKRMAGDSETGRSEGGAILWLAPGLGKTLVVTCFFFGS